jgi:hypothetical protein
MIVLKKLPSLSLGTVHAILLKNKDIIHFNTCKKVLEEDFDDVFHFQSVESGKISIFPD